MSSVSVAQSSVTQRKNGSASYGNILVHKGGKMVIFGDHHFQNGAIGTVRGVSLPDEIPLVGIKSAYYYSPTGKGVDGYVKYLGTSVTSDFEFPVASTGIGSGLINPDIKLKLTQPYGNTVAYFAANPKTSALVSKYSDGTSYDQPLPLGGSVNSGLFDDQVYQNRIYTSGYWAVKGTTKTKIRFNYTSSISGLLNGRDLAVLGWSKTQRKWQVISTPPNIGTPKVGSTGTIETQNLITPDDYVVFTLGEVYDKTADIPITVESFDNQGNPKTAFTHGSVVTFKIKIENKGSEEVTSLSFDSFYPTGLELDGVPKVSPGVTQGATKLLNGGQSIPFTITSLGSGQIVQIETKAIYQSDEILTKKIENISTPGLTDLNTSDDKLEAEINSGRTNLKVEIAGPKNGVQEDLEQEFTVSVENITDSYSVDITSPMEIYIDLKNLPSVQKLTSTTPVITFTGTSPLPPSDPGTFVTSSALPSGIPEGTDAVWTVPPLKKGQRAELKYKVTVPDNQAGGQIETEISLKDRDKLDETRPSGNEADNDILSYSQIIKEKQTELKLEVSKLGAPFIVENSRQTFQLRVENLNGRDIGPFAIDLNLISNQDFARVTLAPNAGGTRGLVSHFDPSPDPVRKNIAWKLSRLNVGEHATIQYVVDVPLGKAGKYLETNVSFQDVNLDSTKNDDDSSFKELIQHMQSDLVVKLEKKGVQFINSGTEETYTLTVFNKPSNVSNDLKNLKIAINIDKYNQTLTQTAPGVGIFTDSGNGDGGIWSIPQLKINSTAKFEYTTKISSSPTQKNITNTVSVEKEPGTSYGPDISHPSLADKLASTLPVVDINIGARVSSSEEGKGVCEGQTVLFTISADNNKGSSYDFKNLEYTLKIDPRFHIDISGITGMGTFTSNSNNGEWLWNIGTLNHGTIAILNINATVPENSNLDSQKMSVEIIATNNRYGLDNSNKDKIDPLKINKLSSSLTVDNKVDLFVGLSATKSSLVKQQYSNFTLTIENRGGYSVKDVVLPTNFEAVLPSKLYQIIPSDGGATYDTTTGQFKVPNIPPGGKVELKYFFDAPNKAGTIVFQVDNNRIISNRIDNNATTDITSLPIKVEDIDADFIDLHVQLTADKNKVIRTETFNYIITVQNLGRDAAENLSIIDKLPSDLIFKSATSEKGSYDSGKGLWLIGSLSPQEGQKKLVITVRVRRETTKNKITNDITRIAFDNNPFLRYHSFVDDLTEVVEVDIKAPFDTDNDGIPDLDEDTNGDGDPENDDDDGDGIPNYKDTDDDGDGIPTKKEVGDDPYKPVDSDGDGMPDYRDDDDDNDGTPTKDELRTGPNGDQVILDNNQNGIPDYLENKKSGLFYKNEYITLAQVITPNGDGYNDVFAIFEIQLYPDNEVKIYNSWGMEVFSTEAYGTRGNVFRGVGPSNEELPEGIYFCYIKFRVEGGKRDIIRTTSLFLKR
ncbi:gliding motility-associated C-terminal domain-containing protein [Elysia marginata]|uniref:Gliding motility-associated C-terminal domain-containing protein n=1 Tax=Elysia marginata TaxID=1093978 RepID=A0AAV4FQU3_9GAST|nr:gliding motility-associated C-terminal domain-containing protein [Elysia marginata]